MSDLAAAASSLVLGICSRCGSAGQLLLHGLCAGCNGVAIAGRKDDGADPAGDKPEKPRWDLVPWEALAPIVRVLTYGARKYSPGNWAKVPNGRARYFAAAMRHLTAWWGGEKNDAETGESHLAGVGCCVLFLLALEVADGK